MKKNKAIFPASFNPVHNAHVKVIEEASKDYDELTLFVANNEVKRYSITINERYSLLKEVVDSLGLKNIKIVMQSNPNDLTPLFAKENNIKTIVRGLKDSKITDYESMLAERYLNENSELTFHYVVLLGETVSSTIIRDKAKNKEDIKHLVPEVVYRKIRTIYE